ncbi:SDR family oxidoreductase [Rhodocaloribacter litoris]|uniref:SDR family oxidoreductase n=1 Tax=Rhodocaloribacter litoris TaxID=2558931 RepID=UPI00141D94C6|nr:SDR family oxidoreductase [Rhodocaloribacter litoris]QXD16522.1 SDR family oxidoreductase [Rhodocaloribacter litoris]
MDLGIRDRIAFVAGASRGLGRAVALELAREGCRVAVCSRDPGRIEEAATYIREAAGISWEHVLPVACDVTDEAQIEEAMLRTVGHFGGLHILVTNAGGPPAGFVDDFDAAQWRAALELNLMSTINLCRHALPHLRKAAAGDGLARILMITSVSAKEPIPNLYLSNVARAGVQGFAKSLALELGPEGITVNTILPGYTRTDRLVELAEAIRARTGSSVEEIERGWAEANALRRIGTEAEFAAAAAFLVSARAGYITGTALVVDGGRVKHLL